MLYIDAAGCVGCRACDHLLPGRRHRHRHGPGPGTEEPFRQLSADYFATFPHADRLPVARVDPERTLARPGPFRVAVVGAGPATPRTNCCATPRSRASTSSTGCARPTACSGTGSRPTTSAPRTSPGSSQRSRVSRASVDVGKDITLAELRRHYDAVIVAVGASADRRLGITGEDLPGSISGTDLVGWYNGHPDQADLNVPLDHERAVVIGNGKHSPSTSPASSPRTPTPSRAPTSHPDRWTPCARAPSASRDPRPARTGGRVLHRARTDRPVRPRGRRHRPRPELICRLRRIPLTRPSSSSCCAGSPAARSIRRPPPAHRLRLPRRPPKSSATGMSRAGASPESGHQRCRVGRPRRRPRRARHRPPRPRRRGPPVRRGHGHRPE